MRTKRIRTHLMQRKKKMRVEQLKKVNLYIYMRNLCYIDLFKVSIIT